MIQANELRIGNWVGNLANSAKVTAILYAGVRLLDQNGEYFEKLNPIPLTPEILEKAGFVKEEGTIECWTKENPEFSICKTQSGGFMFCVLSFETVQLVQKCKMNSLHQLQNLYFALTGTELNISL